MNHDERLIMWDSAYGVLEPLVQQAAASTARRWQRLGVSADDLWQECWAAVWERLPEFVDLLDQQELRLLSIALRRVATAYVDRVRSVVQPDWQTYTGNQVENLLVRWAQGTGRTPSVPDDLVKIRSDEVNDTIEEMADLARGLRHVAEGYRRALIGRALVPSSWSELAVVTGSTEVALRSAHSRGLRRLVNYMNGQPEQQRAA